MYAAAGLDAGLLIGRDHELIGAQRFSIPLAGVQIQDASGFDGELGVARKDPAPMLPGTDGILIEPAPDGLVADCCHQATMLRLPSNVRATQARKWEASRGRQFAGEGFNLHNDLWGEKHGGDPREGALPRLEGVHRRSVFATD